MNDLYESYELGNLNQTYITNALNFASTPTAWAMHPKHLNHLKFEYLILRAY